ncbi:hypothetical protein PILCRDRAFT_829385, partial [Piloderma croceum F 1598]
MHYGLFFQLGPVYAWWLFAFQCFNGLLEKVKLNGHANGVMELTLMRAWLSSNPEGPGQFRHPEDSISENPVVSKPVGISFEDGRSNLPHAQLRCYGVADGRVTLFDRREIGGSFT